MSLYALPVTATDITALQNAILFSTTSTTDINNQVTAINAPGATETVTSYASSLLAGVVSTSQMAMAVSAEETGASQTVATLTNLVNNPAIIPAYVQFATAQGLNVGLVVAEDLGLAYSGDPNFVATYVGSLSSFSSKVSALTGINATFITQQAQYFINLYTATSPFPGNPTPTAAQILAAAEGVAFGLAVGLAVEGVGSQASTFQTQVKNALYDIAQATQSPPGSAYVPGAALAAQPIPIAFQGTTGGSINLTTATDIVSITASNTTVNGTFGGAGATWTNGDTIVAAAGLTNEIFNITGNGTLGVIDPTSLPLNKVSGIQTVNINANVAFGALATEAVDGDFTATGAMGDWVGLTTLNINSGGNPLGADNVKVDATTAVNITDTNTLGTTAGNPLTVTGGSVITITEANLSPNAGGVSVFGGSGTTTVSITQTEIAPGLDGAVTITDAGFATNAAGTITKITLDGLSHPAAVTVAAPGGVTVTGTIMNTISDNALTNLTVNNTDIAGAALSITDNLTTPTATTLTLSLSHNGVNAAGFATGGFASALTLVDTNNEYSTIHLSLGSQNSHLNLIDNGLMKLDTPTAGTGALVGTAAGAIFSTITDHFAGAVSLDFSGLNGPNNIDEFRGSGVNADAFTLGNFGTDNAGATPFTTSQHLTMFNGNAANTATISFGSGAYDITDPGAHGVFAYVNTAANGAGLIAGFPTHQQWADIAGAAGADTLLFSKDTVQNIHNDGAFATITAGIIDALTHPQHDATAFNVAGNTYYFDHAGASGISVSPTDAMVEVAGVVFNANILSASHVIGFA